MDSISTQRKPSPEQAKKELAEQLWLSYYNQVLFEAGLITEAERNRMKRRQKQAQKKAVSTSRYTKKLP